jgi:conflict system pore-forming effector with SLATT domain
METSNRRRFLQSIIPARLSGQVSRPTSLPLSGAGTEASAGGTYYSEDPQSTLQHDQHGPSTHPIRPIKQELVPASDQLATFRSLVGIENAATLSTTYFARPANNIGIYGRITKAESDAKWKHTLFSSLINGCLALQLIVAAGLTALGAGNGPHKAVTAFGAINTVIAGFLTYLKGSSLPDRLGYYRNEWTKVREHIEQLERDFCREGCMLDAETEAAAMEAMYWEVKNEIETNTRDSFVSQGNLQNNKESHPPPRPPPSRTVSYKGSNPAGPYQTGMNRPSQYPSGQTSSGQYSKYPGERRVRSDISPIPDKEKDDVMHMA